jgi:hypothetical protein
MKCEFNEHRHNRQLQYKLCQSFPYLVLLATIVYWISLCKDQEALHFSFIVCANKITSLHSSSSFFLKVTFWLKLVIIVFLQNMKLPIACLDKAKYRIEAKLWCCWLIFDGCKCLDSTSIRPWLFHTISFIYHPSIQGYNPHIN